MKTVFYSENGLTAEEETALSFAKKETTPHASTYYVRRATTGPDAGHLLNPWGIHYQSTDAQKFERALGKRRYEYYRVTEEVFNLYVRFLATRNERLFRQAERSMD